jgi:hypothetical protein
MLNRAALIVRLKQPFVDWINTADPDPEAHFTLDDVNDENNVYLVEVEDLRGLERWLKRNNDILFANELEDWYTDPDLWPKGRTLKMFKDWCTLELHSIVIDIGSTPIEDDEAQI